MEEKITEIANELQKEDLRQGMNFLLEPHAKIHRKGQKTENELLRRPL